PDFNREDLMKITALSKNRLNPFLREYADADGFSDYINRLRVEHSISMLKDNKMYSIDAIATASGFKSRNTYYVAFNKLLGMTPVQYRETLPDKSAEPCTEPIV
ncbi:AraC family transcriptional regulator, partial [Bacteroides uniformis]